MEQLKYVEQNGSLECVFSGSLSTDFCQKNEQTLNEKLSDQTGSVLFDFKDVDYVSSAFLRVCLHALKTLGKDRFRIANASPEVKKIFTMVGFDAMVE